MSSLLQQYSMVGIVHYVCMYVCINYPFFLSFFLPFFLLTQLPYRTVPYPDPYPYHTTPPLFLSQAACQLGILGRSDRLRPRYFYLQYVLYSTYPCASHPSTSVVVHHSPSTIHHPSSPSPTPRLLCSRQAYPIPLSPSPRDQHQQQTEGTTEAPS